MFGIRETHNIIWCQGKGDAPLPFGGYPAPLPPLGEPQHARTDTRRRGASVSAHIQGSDKGINRGKHTHMPV
nr:MAG TPA: hypothetical protein [Caudoviricetes sp.]